MRVSLILIASGVLLPALALDGAWRAILSRACDAKSAGENTARAAKSVCKPAALAARQFPRIRRTLSESALHRMSQSRFACQWL